MFGLSQDQINTLLLSGGGFGVAAYIVRLSGAIMADSKPYHDDRTLSERLSGPVIVVSVFATPALLVGLLFTDERLLSANALRAAGLLFVNMVLTVLLLVRSEEVNRMKSAMLDFFVVIFRWSAGLGKSKPKAGAKSMTLSDRLLCELAEADGPSAGFLAALIKFRWPLVRFALSPAAAFLSVYLLVASVKGGGLVWPAYISAQFFVTMAMLVGLHSVLQAKRQKVDIFFCDSTPPISDAVLLKVTSDYLRVLSDGAVFLIRKDLISRIQVNLGADQYLGEDECKAAFEPDVSDPEDAASFKA